MSSLTFSKNSQLGLPLLLRYPAIDFSCSLKNASACLNRVETLTGPRKNCRCHALRRPPKLGKDDETVDEHFARGENVCAEFFSNARFSHV